MWDNYHEVLRALVIAGSVALLFVLASMLVLRRVIPSAERKLDEEKHRIIFILLDGFKKPLRLWFRVAGCICVALTLLALVPFEGLPDTAVNILSWFTDALAKALSVTTVVCIAWGLVGSCDITSLVLHNKHLDIHMGASVSRFLAAIFNVIIIVIAMGIVLSEFGYDVNGIIAGIGIGGLTLSLAAQKTAANFVGGLVLVLERPFEIGDWIICGAVEGEVEDLTLRSTRVRTQEGSVTTVPNATLADSNITNWTRFVTQRRVELKLSLAPATPQDKLQGFSRQVVALLEAEQEVIPGSAIARLSDISGAALGLTILYDTDKPAYKDYLRVRERINLAILNQAKLDGITLQ